MRLATMCLILTMPFTAYAGSTRSPIEELSDRFPDYFRSIAQTSPGFTHYEAVGSRERGTVVLVHGVSGPMASWDRNVAPLAAAGYRVVRYDLLGRGFSERIAGDYDLAAFERQLETLLSAAGVDGPFFIVGSSFGAVISTAYTLAHPDRVKGLLLIGPAGFPIQLAQQPEPAATSATPPSPEQLRAAILAQNRKYFVDGRPPEPFWTFFQAQLDVPGSTGAIVSTFQRSPVQNFLDGYAALGRASVPVGVIWGREDATFPYSNHETLQRLVPRATLVTVENAAHLPHFERPEVTNKAILDFLSAFNGQAR